MEENFKLNKIELTENIKLAQLDWGSCNQNKEFESNESKFDLIFGSDIMYSFLMRKIINLDIQNQAP